MPNADPATYQGQVLIKNAITEISLNGLLQKCVWFDYTNQMKSATNLVTGMTAATRGNVSVGDGKASVYYIRQKLYSDVIDGVKLIQLNNGLIAQQIANFGFTGLFYVDNEGYICQSD